MNEHNKQTPQSDDADGTQPKSVKDKVIAAKEYAQEQTKKGVNDAKAAFDAAGGVDGLKDKAKGFAASIRLGFVPDANSVGPKRHMSRFANLWRSGMHGKIALSAAGVMSILILLSLVPSGQSSRGGEAQAQSQTGSATPANQFVDDFEASLPEQLRPLYRQQLAEINKMPEGFSRNVMIEQLRGRLREQLSPRPQLICRKCSQPYSPPPPGIISQAMHCSRGGMHEPR